MKKRAVAIVAGVLVAIVLLSTGRIIIPISSSPASGLSPKDVQSQLRRIETLEEAYNNIDRRFKTLEEAYNNVHKMTQTVSSNLTANIITPDPRLLCFIPSYGPELKLAFEIGTRIRQMGCDTVRVVLALPASGPKDAHKAGEGRLYPMFCKSKESCLDYRALLKSCGIHNGDYVNSTCPNQPDDLEVLTLFYAPHVPANEQDVLGMEDSNNLWQKTHHMFLNEWMRLEKAKNGSEMEYTWFVKMDTDTVFIPGNFRRLVAQYDNLKPAYIGHALAHQGNWDYEFNAGACYAFNRRALELVGPKLQEGSKLCAANTWSNGEDHLLGTCCMTVGLFLNSTRDSEGREHFLPFRFKSHVKDAVPPESNGNVKDWFWYNKDAKNVLDNAVAPYPVSAHGYKHQEVDVLEIYDALYPGNDERRALVLLKHVVAIDEKVWRL